MGRGRQFPLIPQRPCFLQDSSQQSHWGPKQNFKSNAAWVRKVLSSRACMCKRTRNRAREDFSTEGNKAKQK